MSDVKRRRKPTVSIVGTGRLGTTLAVVLSHCGYPMVGLVARHLKHAKQAASLLDAAPEVLAAERLSQLPSSDLVLIATPDDQINEVAKELAKTRTSNAKQTVVLHTSGALSSTALAPLLECGWDTGSLHPLVSVSDKGTAPDFFRAAFWCVEGNPTAVRQARRVVRDLKGHSFSIRARDKPLYHAAAVMTSGNVVALFAVALEMLGECGIDQRQAQRILLPLLRSTIRNLEVSDPAVALTGTFSRGDIATVERHLESLKERKQIDALKLYQLLGDRSLELAHQNGLDSKTVKRIKRALKK